MSFFMPMSTNTPFNRFPAKINKVINKNAKEQSSYTIDRFLNAIKHSPQDATLYISKNYVNKVDIGIVPDGVNTPILVGASFTKAPKNCKNHTVLTFSDDGLAFLHFYTLQEEDEVSNWKIYAIDKEEV